MPRYIYKCNECDICFQVWHGMSEKCEECQVCHKNDCLVRIPQSLSFIKTTTEDEKVGRLTEEHIEQNQQLLNDMKKEARNQIYED